MAAEDSSYCIIFAYRGPYSIASIAYIFSIAYVAPIANYARKASFAQTANIAPISTYRFGH